MSVTTRFARVIGRAVAVLLLTLAAATPSLAELGLLEDAAAHRSEMGSSEGTLSLSAGDAHEEEGRGQASGSSHCNFTHCAHSLPSKPPERTEAQQHFPTLAYPPFLAHRLSAAARDGPEYPPRA